MYHQYETLAKDAPFDKKELKHYMYIIYQEVFNAFANDERVKKIYKPDVLESIMDKIAKIVKLNRNAALEALKTNKLSDLNEFATKVLEYAKAREDCEIGSEEYNKQETNRYNASVEYQEQKRLYEIAAKEGKVLDEYYYIYGSPDEREVGDEPLGLGSLDPELEKQILTVPSPEASKSIVTRVRSTPREQVPVFDVTEKLLNDCRKIMKRHPHSTMRVITNYKKNCAKKDKEKALEKLVIDVNNEFKNYSESHRQIIAVRIRTVVDESLAEEMA